MRLFVLTVLVAAASASGQVVNTSATRTASAEACDAFQCDTPPPRSSSSFGPVNQDTFATTEDLFTFTDAVAQGSQITDIQPGLYSGEIVASSSAGNGGGDGTAFGDARAVFMVDFTLDEACDLEFTVDVAITENEGGGFGSGVSEAELIVEITGDATVDVLTAQSATIFTLEDTVPLDAGNYTLHVSASADSSVNNVVASPSTITSATFTVEAMCMGGNDCVCEFAGNPDVVDIQDLLEYLDFWLAGEEEANINGGPVDITDLLEFLDCWLPASVNNGICPT